MVMADFPREVPENNPNHQEVHDELAQLRNMLLRPEQDKLDALQQRFDDPKQFTEDVSRVLPESILLKNAQDKQLTKALIPTVEEALQISVQKNPRILTDAIFPIIGPAIRRAITNAIQNLLQSLNETLDSSFSLQGLQWRLEAFRTGKPFAEIVLLRTLRYRVEQAFLIHRKTGLLLQHVVAEAVTSQDADMVSSMLTAIQAFVRDSFGVQPEDTLGTMQVGELTVWIEQGPEALLAGVIRGTAPETLRLIFQDALETIHFEQRSNLASFQGDSAPFEASKPTLEMCLKQVQQRPQAKKSSPLLWLLPSILLIGGGIWLFSAFQQEQKWTHYVEKLKMQPGLVVITAGNEQGKYRITGLRDPLAIDPELLFQESNLDPASVRSRWELYQSSDPAFVLTRAQDLLQPPATVILRVENGTLYAKGSASQSWIIEARKLVHLLPGVTHFQEDLKAT
jgi:OOP family OmpA-OmpF porin